MSGDAETDRMNDASVGRTFRAVRHRLGKRQVDVADDAGVSRQVVSRIECGRLDEVSLTALRAIANELEIRIDFTVRWRGGELDRLLNRRHAAMHEAALAMYAAQPGWQVVSELSFNVWGERGIIDLAAWNEDRRALVLNELKSEFVDPGELVGTMDRRKRLALEIARSRGWNPLVVAVWVLVEDTRRNRRHLGLSRRLLRGAFPADGHAMRQWLRDPGLPIAGLSFITCAHQAGTSQRVTPKHAPRDGRGSAGRAIEPATRASNHRQPGARAPADP